MKTIITPISHDWMEKEHSSEGATTVRVRQREREKKTQICISPSVYFIEGKRGKLKEK